MRGKTLIAIAFLVLPAVANPRQFDLIHVNQSITIALPYAQCEAKVVSRAVDQLTLELKKTTPCGQRKSIVTLARADVDVIDERPAGSRSGPGLSAAGTCTVAGSTLIDSSAGFYVASITKGNAAGWAIIVGGAALGAILCHTVFFPPGPRYSVFALRVTPLPAAKLP